MSMPVTAKPGAALSLRERRVVELMSEGLQDGAVAAALGIRARTVRFHIANASVKLSAKTRAHLVMRALAIGCIMPASEPLNPAGIGEQVGRA